MQFIKELPKKTVVIDSYEVIVCGGGIAGVSAALAAARQNKKVLLIEKLFLLGGLATSGLVTIYLPLCDGNGKQVSFSIAEELLHLSIKHGYEDEYPTAWLNGGTTEEKAQKRFQVRFNANIFALLLEKHLKENGVELLYGNTVCNAVLKKGKITHVITEGKQGRTAFKTTSVIDTTGDADLCALTYAPTKIFEQGNTLAGWYYFLNGNDIDLKMLGFSDIPDKYKTEAEKNVTGKRYIGLDDLSKMAEDSHAFTLDDFLKNGGINKDRHLSTISTTPQVRMTRRICGEYTMDDTEMHKEFYDSVGLVGDWRKKGPIYEIPFRTLYSKKVKNLITAGRSISVTDAMWDITRVIPCCAVTGEAAGIAASLSDDFSKLDVSLLQAKLALNGVKLHEKDL